MSAKVYLMMMVTFLVLCQVVSEKVSKEKMDTVDEKTISVVLGLLDNEHHVYSVLLDDRNTCDQDTVYPEPLFHVQNVYLYQDHGHGHLNVKC